MPRRVKPFNLFVYGTLMIPSVFRAVLGKRMVFLAGEADNVESFHARDAVLAGHKKVSPDGTYLYAVPDPQGRIRGYVLGPMPGEAMEALLHYEGRNYSRRRIEVHTRDGTVEAVAFLANLKQLEHSFGYAFHDPLKQEILLQRKIESALLETEKEQTNSHDKLGRRAVGELHGALIRDLVRRHFEAGGISDYAIRRTLLDDPLRDFARIAGEPAAQMVAPHYLAMVMRQVLFNQFEEKIHRDFRYELDHLSPGEAFYERTISSVLTLRMLNAERDLLNLLVGDCLSDLSFTRNHLVEFVRWAIAAADNLYEARLAKRELDLVRSHMGRGYIPLGVELEFSNIGHEVIRGPSGQAVRDARYDGFLYFPDFGLDVLTWKLGGHVDDHHDKASPAPRRGFFEVALGNLSIRANISKPLTDDPWVLNQLIHGARRFYRIAPHSVHISFQLRKQQEPLQDRLLSMASMKCLFAIAGDPARAADGRVHIRRLTGQEIISYDPEPHMMFSDISRRHSSEADEFDPSARTRRNRGTYVQQFKFLRLAPTINYEPLAMALKGLQICRRPSSFLTAEQYKTSPKHRRAFEELLAWGQSPDRLTEPDMDTFFSAVHEGLMIERRGRAAHGEAYISWALGQLREMLERFNALLAQSPRGTR